MRAARFVAPLVIGLTALALSACTIAPPPEPAASALPSPDGEWIYVAGTDASGSFFADTDAPARIVIADGKPTVFQPCVRPSNSPALSPCAASGGRFADAIADATKFVADHNILVAAGAGDLELRFVPAPVVEMPSLVGSWVQPGSQGIEVGPNTMVIAADGSISGRSLCLEYSGHLPDSPGLFVTDVARDAGGCAWGETDSFRDALDSGFLITVKSGAFPTIEVLSPGVAAPIIFEHTVDELTIADIQGDWELIAASDSSGDLESTGPIELQISDSYISGTDGCNAIGTQVAAYKYKHVKPLTGFFANRIQAVSLVGCDRQRSAFSARYLDALNATSSARIVDGSLALRSDGTELIFLPKASE